MKETKKTQIESHPIYVHGEKLVLFKSPQQPKQSIGSKQSLSNYKWHFVQKQKKLL